jgi:hypothetical protein
VRTCRANAVVEMGKRSGALATGQDAVPLPRRHRNLWRALRLGALCGNLLYVGGCLVAVGILLGLGPAPWQAYGNVLLAIAIVVATLILNVKAAVRRLSAVASGFAIALNLTCLGYFLFRLEHSSFALMCIVWLVALLNMAVIVSGRDRGLMPAPGRIQT